MSQARIKQVLSGTLTCLCLCWPCLGQAEPDKAGEAAPPVPPAAQAGDQPAAPEAPATPAAPKVTPEDLAKAQKLLDELFGEEIKIARASTDGTDDSIVADKLVKAASNAASDPALLQLLCDNAYALGAKGAEGYASAVTAMQIMARTFPDKIDESDKKIIAIRQKQYAAAKGDEKSEAAGRYVDALVSQADRKLAERDSAAALTSYRSALAIATASRPERKAELTGKINVVSTRMRVDKQIDTIKEKLLKDPPDRQALASELLNLYLVDLDNPAEAEKSLYLTGDAVYKANVPLASGPHDKLTAEQSLALGDWYRGFADKAKLAANKPPMLVRALGYYQHYLEKSTAADGLNQTKAKVYVEKLTAELNRLQPGAAEMAHGSWINLMGKIDPDSHAVKGDWQLKNGVLSIDATGQATIVIPVAPRGSYELQIKFARGEATTYLGFMFPVGNTGTSFHLKNLYAVDGAFLRGGQARRVMNTPDSAKTDVMNLNKEHTLDIKVKVNNEDSEIQIDIDGQKYVQWSGKTADLSPHETVKPPEPFKMSLLVSNVKAAFKSIKIRGKASDLKEVKGEVAGADDSQAELLKKMEDAGAPPQLIAKLRAMKPRQREKVIGRFMAAEPAERIQIIADLLK